MCFALNAQANNSKEEYKCLLETTTGSQIGFYNWKRNQVKSKSQLLVAKKIKSDKKNAYIKDVIECVPLNEDFSSADAKRIDKATVR
ncbi:hypothetical protein HBH39_12460 [Shewanella aestuarii]|uniref:Uncharacterized protein n=1 Tax=Shewanella aestuarii TaxID=1028752 RepID=A0A6G9QQZ3_9GAMM|nr:hypothetical protein HBH39_12460 [Shewanella aestuarii]